MPAALVKRVTSSRSETRPGTGIPCAINALPVIRREDIVAVLPAYNCADTVGEVVRGLAPFVAQVIVVDDGSTDRTARVAADAGARVVVHESNRGKGAALRTGLGHALGLEPRALALLDADGQHDPMDLPDLVRVFEREGAALVVGCRLQDRESIPPVRFWTNYIGTRILSWMTGQELLDSQSGYRLLDSGLARKLDLRSNGYSIESEMLIRAASLGSRIAHAPIRTIYRASGVSHFRPLQDTFRISCEAIACKVFRADS